MPTKDRDKRRAYQREFYKKNRKKVMGWVSARKAKNREFVHALKEGKVCTCCGESDPVCLVFHHRDPSQKSGELGDSVMVGWSKEKILNEVAKCDLVCANCHMKIHNKWRKMGYECDGSTTLF